MKAAIYTQYGPPEVIAVKEVPTPTPKNDEVLVKVHAASVNSWDWDLVRGKPYVYRLLFGLPKPKHPIIGSDIAGKVEAVGKDVTQFQPGDEVFGDISGNNFGAFAEYTCARENVLAIKPSQMTFEKAAAIPQAAVLALQGLRQGHIEEGKKVLINGAGGGVGTFAVQMAKSWGAEITGVDSAEKLEMLRALGASHVIDYRQSDFTQQKHQYDLILDMITRHSPFDYRRVLTPTGRYVMVGGLAHRILQLALLSPLLSKANGQNLGLLVHRPNPEDLNTIAAMIVNGQVTPVIDQCFPLSKVSEAIRYLGEGHAQGKVVITM